MVGNRSLYKKKVPKNGTVSLKTGHLVTLSLCAAAALHSQPAQKTSSESLNDHKIR